MSVLSILFVSLIVNLVVTILLLAIKAFEFDKAALVVPIIIFGAYNFFLLASIGNLLVSGLQ